MVSLDLLMMISSSLTYYLNSSRDWGTSKSVHGGRMGENFDFYLSYSSV